MAKIVVLLDDVVIKEYPLNKERTTIGRRPYNDVIIDNLAVSGEHAVIITTAQEVVFEDLGSTNGSFLKGKAIKRHVLQDGETLELAKYALRYEQLGVAASSSSVTPAQATPAAAPMAPTASAPTTASPAYVRIINGPAAGRELALQKVVTTVGKPGVCVAAITKRHQHYVIAYVEGDSRPQLNGTALGEAPAPLHHGDRISLAGTEMNFVQE